MIAAAIVVALLLAGCTTAPVAVLAAAASLPVQASQPHSPSQRPTSSRPRNPNQSRNTYELQRNINRILAPTSERATWGVLVKSLTTNDTLYALNPRKLLLPASNMKLVTLAAAAERLGWTFSYETR